MRTPIPPWRLRWSLSINLQIQLQSPIENCASFTDILHVGVVGTLITSSINPNNSLSSRMSVLPTYSSSEADNELRAHSNKSGQVRRRWIGGQAQTSSLLPFKVVLLSRLHWLICISWRLPFSTINVLNGFSIHMFIFPHDYLVYPTTFDNGAKCKQLSKWLKNHHLN